MRVNDQLFVTRAGRISFVVIFLRYHYAKGGRLRRYSDWATGWTVRGSNPGECEVFHTRPDRPCGPPSLLYSGYRVSFPGVKRPRRGVDHPPPSSADVKERVGLYLYSPSGPSWPVLERPLHLPLRITYGTHDSAEHILGTASFMVSFFTALRICSFRG